MVDRLLRGGKPSQEDRTRILEAVAKADFEGYKYPASFWERPPIPVVGQPNPVTGQPITRDQKLSSLEAHTVKRQADGRLKPGATPDQFLDDLHLAAQYPKARVVVGKFQGAPKVGIFLPLDADDLSLKAFKVEPRRELFVVYNVRSGRIASGYTLRNTEAYQQTAAWKPRKVIPA